MPVINGQYYTEAEIRAIKRRIKDDSDDAVEKFLISGAIGAVTGSTVVGALFGGSILGALTGDILEGDEDSWL